MAERIKKKKNRKPEAWSNYMLQARDPLWLQGHK